MTAPQPAQRDDRFAVRAAGAAALLGAENPAVARTGTPRPPAARGWVRLGAGDRAVRRRRP